ncbi:hypothetical protein QFC22_004489 [Naganishia vaughanmartiniae]|uniref:Uncharacterized protein n=1 Tax=Naganishia vaughanmartiniae TaxID=1424756 RepID=A0ACC2X0V1_9TREE|nr:hypothetical protein QFC22_004489 [Naganishia vaughanmartiniae]
MFNMPPDQSHPDHQHTSHRGGLPLEARLPPRIREGSTPTLGNTIATSHGIAVLIVTGGSLYAVYTLVKKWLEQNGRSKARDEALRELLGVPDDEEEVEQLMPGSATAYGSFVTTGGLESKSKIGGKRGKRVVSKSNDAPQLRSRSSSASLRSPTTNQHSTTPPIQHLASKLKAFIPALSASSSKTIHAIPAIKESTPTKEATTSNATNAVEQISSEQEAGRTEPDMQQPTLTAAERKKLKKKQNRANRAQDKSLLSGSAESDVRDSPSPGGSIISLPSTFEQSVFSQEDASRDVHMLDPVRPRRPERPNAMHYKNTSDPELVTPTATANTTPKASTRSKMAGPLPVSMLRDESPTRRRSSASTDDNADVYRDSISSAPSLVSAFSPKSGRSRAESVASLPPVTPLTTNAGLNIPDADLGTMKEDENERAWQKVGKKEKAERRQKGKGRLEAESRMGPVSPPVSTASGTSSEFNLLMNAESRPTQSSTDASSVGWSSELGQAGPCPKCGQRRQNDEQRVVFDRTVEASSEQISELQKKLEETIGEERKQKAIIDSLTGTNIGLSGQLATLRDQRDKSMAEAQVARDQLDGLRRELDEARTANRQLDGLRRELGEARDMTVRLQTQINQHQDYERVNIDYKRKFDNMVQKHETYRLHTTRVSDEVRHNSFCPFVL